MVRSFHSAFFVIGLVTVLAGSQHSLGDCVQEVLEFEEVDGLSSQEFECIADSEEFNLALDESLCADDLEDISKEFKSYLSYYANEEEIVEELRDNPTAREKAKLHQDLHLNDQKWMVLGFRQLVDGSLFLVGRAVRQCLEQE